MDQYFKLPSCAAKPVAGGNDIQVHVHDMQLMYNSRLRAPVLSQLCLKTWLLQIISVLKCCMSRLMVQHSVSLLSPFHV